MASKNFLLVSLDESRTKQLAQIVSNDLCRKMLDFLAGSEKGATETEIATALGIPLSTAHYNIRQLLESGIVKADEYHYSAKGREVLHYSLANKYIIIAPTATNIKGLASKLKQILPVAAITIAGGFLLQFLTATSQSAPSVQREALPFAAQGTEYAMEVKYAIAHQTPSIALWFAAGAVAALTLYFLYDTIIGRKKTQ